MGTYDTRGGTPLHDRSADSEPAVSNLEDEVLGTIETAQTEWERLNAARTAMQIAMTKAIRLLLKPGQVIDLRQMKGLPEFLWSTRTVRGADRGTKLFRIESEPAIQVDVIHPNLSRWTCEATPISEKTGKDMSGRASSSHVTRDTVRLGGYFGATDRSTNESGTDLAMRTVRAAAEAAANEDQKAQA